MTPLVVLLFFFAVEYLATLPVRVKQGAFLAVVLEFFLSRGIHLLFLGTEGSVVWDGNADLKGKYALVFARDIIGNSSGLWITTIPLILFLVIGWKSLLIDRKVISTH
jgi:ABC-type Mn2+/Zn2+ transport system permease subunit